MRKLLILACVVALVAVMAFPASAAILSFTDYITDYGVDANDQNFVECTMPAAGFLIHVMNGASIVHETTGSGYTYNFSSGQDPGFRVYPFGAKNRMELKDIPNGTQLDFTVTVSNSANAVNGQLSCYIQYFDGDLALLSTTTLQNYTGGIPYTWDISHVMNYPEGAEYFQIYLYLNGWTVLSSVASFGISCSDFVFTMDITYLPDDSAVLENISNQLRDVNDQLNDINNQIKDPDPVLPSGSDDISDVIEQEENLLSEWNEYVDSYNDHLGIGSGILLDRAASFAAVALMVDDFATTGFFYELITISLIIGVVGFLLGSSMYAFGRLTRGSSRLKGEYANIGGKVRRIG